MKILVINGPNINLLGKREPELYGHETYNDLLGYIKGNAIIEHVDVECYQSNHEGDIIDKIQDAYGKFQGIIINAGGYTHTSVAILDALRAVGIPTIEVHLTDINNREPYRRKSLISEYAIKSYTGQGFEGYKNALCYLKNM